MQVSKTETLCSHVASCLLQSAVVVFSHPPFCVSAALSSMPGHSGPNIWKSEGIVKNSVDNNRNMAALSMTVLYWSFSCKDWLVCKDAILDSDVGKLNPYVIYIHTQSRQSAKRFSSRWNWDSPTPLASGDCAPPPTLWSGGEGTLVWG